jgi:hypothetical protein
MKINLEGVSAPRLELDLTGPGGEPRTLSFTDLVDAALEFDRAGNLSRIRSLRGTSAVLDQLEWPLPGGGRVTASSRGALSAVVLALDIGQETNGRCSVSRLEAGALAIELAGGQRLALDVSGRAVSVEQSPERNGHASAERLELANLQTALAGWLVRLSTAALDRPRVDWQGGGILFGASAVRLGELAVAGHGLGVEVAGIELPEGIRTSGKSLVLPHLVIPELRLSIDDVVERLRRPAPPPEAPPVPASEAPPAADTAPASRAVTGTIPVQEPPFDYGFLDRVTGRLDVDVTMELTIPVLGRRTATHHFRVPIVSGVINYREVERDLANLEDAFIDLEVRGQRLVLERTIPLIPGLEKPLLFWDLEADERDLAKKRLIRLRTIPRLRLPPKVGSEKDKADKPGGFAVRRVKFDNVDVALALAPPADGEGDSVARARAAELRVGGRIDFHPQQSADPGQLTLAAERLGAGPAELTVRGAAIEFDSIEIGAIAEATVEMHGFRPRGVRLVLKDLQLRNLRVQLEA